MESLIERCKRIQAERKQSSIERGDIIAVSNGIEIKSDYTVLLAGIPVGSCKNHLVWYEESERPAIWEIKQLVYLGDYAWGVRELSTKWHEFQKLDRAEQISLLDKLVLDEEGI